MKVNLFYITFADHGILLSELNGIPAKRKTCVAVMHRQLSGMDSVCANFYYGCCTVSKMRAMKAAKVFCKQMNTYYPTKIKI